MCKIQFRKKNETYIIVIGTKINGANSVHDKLHNKKLDEYDRKK